MAETLKIAFLLDDTLDKTDGVQQYITTLGAYYSQIGHEVHYLVAETARTDIKNIHSLVKYVSVSFNQNNVRTPLPAKAEEIKKLLHSLDLDVLHVQMPYSPFFAAKVIRSVSSKTKVIGTFHILPASKMHELTNRILRVALVRSLRRFDHIVSVSAPAAVFAKKVYGIKSIVVPNAVDISRFQNAPINQTRSSKKRIVFLGRFVMRKGPRELVLALRELVATYNINNLEVVMAGKGPRLDDIKMLARHNGLAKIISFPGFIDENIKSELLASADIAVFPSLGGESFGIVLVEAMASGAKIVLGGNNPGYASVLAQRPELLFNPRDPKAFAHKLKSMLLNRHTKEITAWQTQHIKQYDVSVVANKLMKLYLK